MKGWMELREFKNSEASSYQKVLIHKNSDQCEVYGLICAPRQTFYDEELLKIYHQGRDIWNGIHRKQADMDKK